MSTFACRPVCEATHLVHAIDTGLHGHVLLVNMSLACDAPISLQLWRQAEASEAQQVQPPLRRAGLRCASPPPSDQTGSRSRELDSWVVSNMWDDVHADVNDLDRTSMAQGPGDPDGPSAPDAQAASDTASNTVRALWTCRAGERGGVVLEGEDALRAPGKLVSVALAAHLAPAPDSQPGSFHPHVLVIAAWDRMCKVGPDDETAGLPCRTLFTTTRLPLQAFSTADS